jgi:PKD repeat protein
VSFNASTSDPGQVYGFTYAWTISDGTTSNQGNFNHQFAADGDYTVDLTATTADGRSASTSQVVHVLTKDVAITNFSIPQTARVNQTKTISVDIQNKRYSDYVQVTLYKGIPGGGDVQIGTLTIYVPARASRPTTFKFSYTFTADDAKIGKVTFKAIASIVNGRDVLPADNTSIATTSVSK